MRETSIKKGDIYWVDFDPAKETETKKRRPAVICSSTLYNDNSKRVIVAPITSNIKRVYTSLELEIKNKVVGKVMVDQIRTVDKSRLSSKKISSLSIKEMEQIDEILKSILSMK